MRGCVFRERVLGWCVCCFPCHDYLCGAWRCSYDETGEFEDEVVVNAANEAMWNDYWRALFPKVTTDAISKFSASYRESKEETTDVLRSCVVSCAHAAIRRVTFVLSFCCCSGAAMCDTRVT